MTAKVMTVLGPVAPEEIGVTMSHEHLLIDLTCLWHQPFAPWQQPLVQAPPALESRGLLALDPYVSQPNLRLDEPDVALEELQRYREVGGHSLVDLTVQGIQPDPLALCSLSMSSQVHVIMGCGYYVHRAHPPELHHLSQAQITDSMVHDITHGFGDTGVRPGIIGELGTSSPIHPDEAKILRAAVQAQRETGLAINVHVSIWAREALEVLSILERAGADLTRVVISHLDEMLDLEYHRAVLRRGAYVEYDTFGSEFYSDSSGEREPSDGERLDALVCLLQEGWDEQILLSQDVCTKMHLLSYGGYGYGHILRTIVPRLRRRGIGEKTIHSLLVDNPARVLSYG